MYIHQSDRCQTRAFQGSKAITHSYIFRGIFLEGTPARYIFFSRANVDDLVEYGNFQNSMILNARVLETKIPIG